ncbi:MAG: DUF4382 domain-containing protein [Anaerolineae bacterium]
MRSVVSLGLLLGLVLLAGCGPASGTGQVTIRLAADIRDPGRLEALEITVETVGVHRAGRPIETDWITWKPEQEHVDLAALAPDGTIHVGAGDVPAGRYDRVRVVVEAGRARTAGGKLVPLTLTVEPIAVPFELKNGDQVEITIELIALARPDGGYELFTKSATIVSDQ